jgi:hypothetical protein
MAGSGRVVLVTGAQQGIGEAMAIAFAAAGYDVAINWLDNQAAAEAVAATVRETGRRALTVRADVARLDEISGMVDATLTGLGRLDVLVNNAGVFPRVRFFDMTEADWDLVVDINLKGSAFCAQAAARAMVAAGHGGSVINLSSRSLAGAVLGVHYSATKARRGGDDSGDGFGAGAARHPGQRHRPGPDRHSAAALWQYRGRAAGNGADRAAGTDGDAGRYRCAGRVPRVRRGVLHHRAGASHQWRRIHGVISAWRRGSALASLATCRGGGTRRCAVGGSRHALEMGIALRPATPHRRWHDGSGIRY